MATKEDAFQRWFALQQPEGGWRNMERAGLQPVYGADQRERTAAVEAELNSIDANWFAQQKNELATGNRKSGQRNLATFATVAGAGVAASYLTAGQVAGGTTAASTTAPAGGSAAVTGYGGSSAVTVGGATGASAAGTTLFGMSTSTAAKVGAGIYAASTAFSLYSLEKVADEQIRMAEISRRENEARLKEERKIADIKNIREQRQALRAARIQRAALINLGANTGTRESSGVAGAVASVSTQTASNLGYFGQVKEGQNTIFDSQEREVAQVGASMIKQAGIQTRAAYGQAVGNIGAGIFSAAGGFKTIFG